METVGWMDGLAGGRGIIMPDTTHGDGMEEGRNREDDLEAEVLT